MRELLKRRLTFILSLAMCVSMIQLPAATVYAEDDFMSDDFYEAAQEMNQDTGVNVDINAEVNTNTNAEINAETEIVEPAKPEEENDFLMEKIPVEFADAMRLSDDDVTVSGVVTEGNTMITIGEGELLRYRFTPEQSGKYHIYTASDRDTYGYLYNEYFYTIESDDDSGDNSNFSIIADLEEGLDYYIGVKFYNSTVSDTVSLCIEKMKANAMDEICKGTLGLGSNIIQTEGTNPVIYSFTPEASGTYYVYSNSEEYDTRAYCFDKWGNQIAYDDDSINVINFAFSFFAEAGETYYIQSNTYESEPAEVELIIRRGDADSFECTLAEDLYLNYSMREDGVEILNVYGTFPQVLAIPSAIDGYPVVRLSCIDEPDGLAEVILPDTLKEIGREAFQHCYDLKKINIPSSLQEIEDGAFHYFRPDSIVGSSLNGKYYVENHILYGDYGESVLASDTGAGNVVIPEGVVTIEKNAFASNKGVTSVTLPGSLRIIGEAAFYNCSNLQSVTFHEGLQEIQEAAFEYSSYARFNDLPDSVCSIGMYAFRECSSRNNYHIPSSLNEIGREAFNGGAFNGASASGEFFAADNILYGNYGKDIVCIGNIGSELTIAEGIEVIPEYAFTGKKLEHVTFPSTLKRIEEGAFEYCRELTAIDIPDSVTEIGRYAFLECEKATRIHIPASITSCSQFAFMGCTDVQTITGGNPANGYYVVNNVFYIMQDDTNEIAVAGKNVRSFDVPEGILTIDDYAFENCKKLTTVTLPSTLISIGSKAFSNCSSLTQIRIPDSVEEIEYGAFWGCSSLSNVTLSENITTLETQVFGNCTSLTSIVIPDQVTAIKAEAFYNCSALTTVKLPASLEYLGGSVFLGCNNLRSVTGGPADGSVGMKDGILYTNNGSTVSWAAPWITAAELQDGVTEIGDSAFRDCINLEEITLPDSVTYIGFRAFINCAGLKKIEIPSNVKYIRGNTFTDCTSLAEVILPEGLESIGYYAFENCSSLRTINFPQSLREIENKAFASSGLTSVSLPSGITELAPNAFAKCPHLTTLTGTAANGCFRCYSNCLYVGNQLCLVGKNKTSVPVLSSTDTIGMDAFFGCNKLTQYTVPEQIRWIEVNAFENCVNLTEITLPSDLENLEGKIFLGCDSLQNIYTSSANGRYVSKNGVLYGNYGKELEWYPYAKTDTALIIGSEVTSLLYHSLYNCSNLKKVYFEGNAPKWNPYAIEGCTFTGYYPKDNMTWDGADIMEEAEGITWVPYTPGQIVPDKTSITSIKSAATGIALSWKACEGADGYYIYRSIYGENKYSKIKTIKNGATTSTTDTKVESGVTYIYKIKAYNESGSSAYSATKYTRYMAVPGNVKAENVLTGIKVTWEPVEGVTGYTVYRRGPGENVFKSIKTFTTPNTLSYTNTGIGEAYGNAYEYAVQAYYTTSSGKTTYTSALPDTGTRMIRIRSVEVPTLKNLSTGVKISWSLVDGADGYKVYRKADGEADYKLVYTTTKATTVSYTNTSAKNGIRYSYKVAAYVNDGSKVYLGRLSNEKTIVRLDQMVLSAIATPSAGKLTAIWEANPAGVPYQLEYSTSSTFSSYTRKSFGKSATTTTLTGLISGKTYYVRIRSYFKEADGTTYYSAWSTAKSIKVK